MYMRIRLFLHTMPLANSPFWRDLGILYLKGLIESGFDVEAVGIMVGDLRDPESPAALYPDAFIPRKTESFVSMVIGFGMDYRIHLHDAAKNLALTASRPKEPTVDQVAGLTKFDHVLVPSEEEAATFFRLGCKRPPRVLKPTSAELKSFFQTEVFA